MVLLTALLVLVAQAAAVQNVGDGEVDRAAWAARLAALTDENWRPAFSTGDELARLAPEVGYEILAESWPALPTMAKQQMLKAWNFATPYPLHPRLHRRLLDALRLGVTDPDPAVQSWAFTFLQGIAFQDFAEDYQAYLAWHDRNRARPLDQVMTDECRRFVGEMTSVAVAERKRVARVLADVESVFRDVPSVREAARDAGILDAIAEWVGTPGADRDTIRAAIGVLGPFEADEAYLRRVILPAATQTENLELAASALHALGYGKRAWAVDDLLAVVTGYLEADGRTAHWFAARALADIGDPRVIPTLIGVIDADNTYETIYGVGYFGLTKLTGVNYDESHDGAWWREWWDRNRDRYPEGVRRLEIPSLTRKVAVADAAPVESAELPSQDILAGGDPRQRYFLLGSRDISKAPSPGFRLLLVLPGGDGSADFHPFVKNIYRNAMTSDYLVAQLVAPRWSKDQFDNVVWPTKGHAWESMEFPTETFVRGVVEDIGKRYPIDPRYVFTLSWSSGGPAAYATSLDAGTPVTGSLVAMSVFKPAQLPDLAAAQGHAYYILHSSDDFIPMSFPESARDALAAHGATTRMTMYAGGHGWHGDVFGMIRTGVEWLETQRDPE